MAILDMSDGNIVDAESINWRRIAYPVVGFIVLLLGGLGIYYYQLSQRDQLETTARQEILQAKTAADLRKVADQYPKTTQATLALLDAANLSMTKRDYTGAAADYRRAADSTEADRTLRDSAQLGLGSAFEAANKIDDAIAAYLVVAHRGKAGPYAPFAYTSAARLYEQKNDKANERKTLGEAAALGGDSPFVKEAQYQLKALTPPPAPSAPPTTAAPAPVAPSSTPAH